MPADPDPEITLVPHWIGGKPFLGDASSDQQRTGQIVNPATGKLSGEVMFASADVVDQAVRVAEEAWQSWRHVSIAERTRVLFGLRELLVGASDELASIITAEHGKTHADALGEIARGIDVVEFACGVGDLLRGGYSENVSSNVDTFSLRQPLGVVAGITPFNFPAMVPMWMFPVALACGNAFILKPSEKDPSAAVFVAGLLADAGLPDGVFSVVHGDSEAVDGLLGHPLVRAVSFVGSTPVARHIYETATKAGKRVQALGGAKNHMVVLPDADVGQAADAAVSAGFGSAGERCMAVSVVVAVAPVADELIGAIAERISSITVGPGDDPDSEMGPLVTEAHRDRVVSYVDGAAATGAQVVIDGRSHDRVAAGEGWYLGPTLLDHVGPDMPCYTDEIFGPVLCVVRTASYDEAVALVNANPYGNGVAIFTNDGGAARRFQHEVEVGMVGVNVPIPVPVAYYPFGGWKASLFGDLHAYGRDGVAFYTRGKFVTSRWPDPALRAGGSGGVQLGFPSTGKR
jgi:malonate-semialdehyde dehydrogenase (acetylating)/methylmalonate-semialdehyde dehydrogenase